MRKRSPQGAVPGVLSAVGSLVGRRRVMRVVVIYAEMPLPLVMGGRVWVFYCEQAIERPNERQSKQAASKLARWMASGGRVDGGGQNGVEGSRRWRVEIVGDGLVGGVEWYGEECGKRG